MLGGSVLQGLRLRAASRLLCSLGLAACASSLAGHDVWLEPSTHRAEPGESVAVDVLLGEDFRGEKLPRQPHRIADFWVEGSGWRAPVRGAAGVAPAGVVRLPATSRGVVAVHYRSRPASVRLTREQFAEHLTVEGLDGVARQSVVESGDMVREVYSRCVSTLIEIRRGGAAMPPPPDCPFVVWPVGDTLEVTVGEPLELMVRMGGAPLADARVSATHHSDPGLEVISRSDGDGRVQLDLPATGVWLVESIHLEPDRSEEVDWRSWWATLTFQVRSR